MANKEKLNEGKENVAGSKKTKPKTESGEVNNNQENFEPMFAPSDADKKVSLEKLDKIRYDLMVTNPERLKINNLLSDYAVYLSVKYPGIGKCQLFQMLSGSHLHKNEYDYFDIMGEDSIQDFFIGIDEKYQESLKDETVVFSDYIEELIKKYRGKSGNN